MNRRAFLKLGAAGLLGVMFPKLGTERIAMSRIGDVLADALFKLGNGEPLSKEELDVIRLQGNLTDANNAYVGGLQSGVSKISPASVDMPIGVIYSKTLERNESTVEITNISTVWKHLMIIIYGRGTSGTYPNSGINAYVNGDTGNNYNHQNMSANGTIVSAQQVLNNVQFRVGFVAGSGVASNRASGSHCIIPHYRSNFFKYAIILSSVTNTSDDTCVFADSVWKNTDPIKKLSLYAAAGGSIKAGSAISVYGML